MSPPKPYRDPPGSARNEPIDPDVDLHDPGQRSELTAHPWVLPVIATGGALGATGRYALEQLWPHAPGSMPWATFLANVSGCLLLGVVMVVVTEAGRRHPLWRPFFGVGVLGGYTTFSTYIVQVHQATQAQAPALALAYLFGTLAAAIAAVAAGSAAARRVFAGTGRHGPAAMTEPETADTLGPHAEPMDQ